MNRASCLCGDVTWEIDDPLDFTTHCHCSRCRKTHGVGLVTLAAGSAAGFRLEGRERVSRFQSSDLLSRCFCSRCGSVVPGDAYEGLMFVPAGNFHDAASLKPMAHIFVASKAPWVEIKDSLPQYDAYPPGVDSPELPDIPITPMPGTIRGSCLCGAVGYVVEGELLRCWNCHCGRCRKGRSAAYASNLFTNSDGVRFTRGEDRLDLFKLSEAKHFAQVFCRVCGSLLPRLDHGRGLAIIPMGSLDDDPGMRPQGHIFVESKAPWFEITDDLPQHAEYPSDR